jgi:glycosyltransferase involved in cell wall biosynthesis
MSTPQVTIGFPTYMRRDSIVARVKALLSDPLAKDIPLLVIDNDSTDGTYEALRSEFSAPQLTVLRNDTNIGGGRNMFRLLRECQTEYLLMMSDEDGVNMAHWAEFLAFLEERKPLFVSPQAILEGSIYRGRTESCPIAPEDFINCSFYMSCLAYHRDSANRFLEEIESLDSSNTAARMYPIVMLAMNLMLHGPAWWFSRPLATLVEDLPTHFFDTHGKPHFHLPSRWQQHLGFQQYLDAYDSRPVSDEQKVILASMRKGLENQVFLLVNNAIQAECPRSLKAFQQGANAHYDKLYREKHRETLQLAESERLANIEERNRLIDLIKQLTATTESQDAYLKQLSTENNRLLGIISQKEAEEVETRQAHLQQIARHKAEAEAKAKDRKGNRWLSRIYKVFMGARSNKA